MLSKRGSVDQFGDVSQQSTPRTIPASTNASDLAGDHPPPDSSAVAPRRTGGRFMSAVRNLMPSREEVIENAPRHGNEGNVQKKVKNSAKSGTSERGLLEELEARLEQMTLAVEAVRIDAKHQQDISQQEKAQLEGQLQEALGIIDQKDAAIAQLAGQLHQTNTQLRAVGYQNAFECVLLSEEHGRTIVTTEQEATVEVLLLRKTQLQNQVAALGTPTRKKFITSPVVATSSSSTTSNDILLQQVHALREENARQSKLLLSLVEAEAEGGGQALHRLKAKMAQESPSSGSASKTLSGAADRASGWMKSLKGKVASLSESNSTTPAPATAGSGNTTIAVGGTGGQQVKGNGDLVVLQHLLEETLSENMQLQAQVQALKKGQGQDV